MADEELLGLLAAGERAAFRGVPAQGLVPLQRALDLGLARRDIDAAGRAAWLMGVCHAAVGQFGRALVILSEVCSDHEVAQSYRSRAASAVAGVHRQVGQSTEGRQWDLAALEAAGDDREALFDAQVGLAADAVALGQQLEAAAAIDAAGAVLDPLWWRQPVQLDWARAELALLIGDAPGARAAGERALDAAEASGSPRFVARSLLLAGAAAAADGHVAGAVDLLSRAAALAEGLGTRPLIWASRALLAALQADRAPAESEQGLGVARAVIREIADDLPDPLDRAFLARPDVAAILT